MELLESSDLILAGLCNLEEKTLSLLPAKAGIGDGFSINMIMDFLAAIFDVALDHQPFDQFVDVVAVTAAVKYFFCNTDLLQILLVGVGVVGINHACRILQVLLGVQLTEQTEIFVVIVRKYLSVLVDSTAEYGVSKGVAGGVDIPSSVNKGVSMLSSNNRVQHNTEVTTCRLSLIHI